MAGIVIPLGQVSSVTSESPSACFLLGNSIQRNLSNLGIASTLGVSPIQLFTTNDCSAIQQYNPLNIKTCFGKLPQNTLPCASDQTCERYVKDHCSSYEVPYFQGTCNNNGFCEFVAYSDETPFRRVPYTLASVREVL